MNFSTWKSKANLFVTSVRYMIQEKEEACPQTEFISKITEVYLCKRGGFIQLRIHLTSDLSLIHLDLQLKSCYHGALTKYQHSIGLQPCVLCTCIINVIRQHIPCGGPGIITTRCQVNLLLPYPSQHLSWISQLATDIIVYSLQCEGQPPTQWSALFTGRSVRRILSKSSFHC